MTPLCDTIDTLAMVYLDDELDAAERRELELHLHECAACRDHIAAERRSRVELRARLAAPPAPALLRARIDRALDGEDRAAASTRRVALSRWILPGGATVAAAAALAVFIVIPPQQATTVPAGGSIAREAIKVQARQRPLEVEGPGTRMWLAQNFEPDVAMPSFDDAGVREVGARLVEVGDYDAAQIFYEVVAGPTRLELQAFVLKDVRPGDLRGTTRVAVDAGDLWVTEMDGPNGRTSVVSYVDGYNYGYVFMSRSLSPQALVNVVVESDLIRQAGARIR